MRLSLALAVLVAAPVFAQQQQVTIVGVVASVNDEVAKKQADAFASFVAIAIKDRAISKVYPDQEALALALVKDEVDVALLGPLGYLRVDPKAGAQLLFRTTRAGKSTYRSVLFAPPKSKLGSLEDLRKEKKPLKVAWVEASSTTGYLLPKATLLAAGINPVQSFEVQDFLGSHDAVCKAVIDGKYDLGATFSDQTPNDTRASGCVGSLGKKADTLKIIATSTEVPNDVVVAAAKFPGGKAQAIVGAAKAAAATPEGKKTLQGCLLADGVADVKDDDFAPVRKALDTFVP